MSKQIAVRLSHELVEFVERGDPLRLESFGMEVETERDAVEGPARPDGRGRRALRSTLIYFGLARDPDEPETPTPLRDLYGIVLAGSFAVNGVAHHHGTTAGLVVLAMFVPLLVVCIAKVARRDLVSEATEAPLLIIPFVTALSLWAVPRHAALWIPLTIAAVIALPFVVAAAVNRDSAR